MYAFAMMLFLSLALLGLASAAAAPPSPPSMSDTFKGSGTVSIDLGDELIKGTFVIARWQFHSLGVESEFYPSPIQSSINKALLRYKDNTTFYIRGDSEDPNCFYEARNFNGMPKFWEWLPNADFVYNSTIDGDVYNFWGDTVGGVRFEFGATQAKSPKSKMLYYFSRKSVESNVRYNFTVYTIPKTSKEAEKLFSKLFDPPKSCF